MANELAIASPKQDAAAVLLATHIVRTRGVWRTYPCGGQPLHALQGVDFSVRRGEYVSIMGPSGSGKSTLFNMIGGLDKPSRGQVFIDEVNIAALDSGELAWLRCHKIGYVFQTFNLIPVISALDNVMMPMLFAGTPQADAQDRAAELLRRVGLGERILHKPVQMSGGQQQRVAVARALANGPSILLADEPTGNLDARTGHEIIELLRELNRTEGVTVVSATHDHKMLSVSDRIAWIRDGRVERFQRRDEIDIREGRAQASPDGRAASPAPARRTPPAAPAAVAPAADIIISARNLKRRYAMGEEEVWALAGIDLDVRRGEYLSIMGPSGSGKSTLFNIIGGLDLPTEGDVFIDGVDLRTMGPLQFAFLRCHKVGYIFQTFNLIPVMTALGNVVLPMTFAGMSDAAAADKARGLLDRVGLGQRCDHLPGELSGGQQQRVAIARALANDPSIILADEPTGNLDLRTGEEIIRLLETLKSDRGVTVISATHDHKMLAASNRVIYLVDGRVTDVKQRGELDISFGTIDGKES